MDIIKNELYADIIIDVSAEALDRSFQYRIPEPLKEKVSTGSKVNVPFGRGARMITGYVIKVSDKPKIEVSKIKDIDSICEKQISIDDKMISLAFWIKEQFG